MDGHRIGVDAAKAIGHRQFELQGRPAQAHRGGASPPARGLHLPLHGQGFPGPAQFTLVGVQDKAAEHIDHDGHLTADRLHALAPRTYRRTPLAKVSPGLPPLRSG
ncbi:MAG: hypothetical protein ACREOH_23425 [Candidatus Entotheonellia bacterium]